MNAPVIRPYLAVLCPKGLESVPHSCEDVTIRTLVPQPFGYQSSLGFGTYVHVSADQEAERDRDYDCDGQNRASGQRSPRSAPSTSGWARWCGSVCSRCSITPPRRP